MRISDWSSDVCSSDLIALFDIVQHLGTLAFPAGPVLAWWMTGMVIHATVGAIWAIFYAYFFWSTFDWPPAFQGMAFSLLPTLLALFIAYPQLQMMHLDEIGRAHV